MTVELSQLQIAQPVRYLIGIHNGKTAKISNIRKSPLSIKDTHVVMLTFDDDSLTPHLKTQSLTAYNGIIAECEIDSKS
ncbi:hypothetical protein [Nostoc favosum]|uniref:Uncharacterized protein n=1 Tax=Nostoc favosum CHAB5714 TaxID=2780399 RepID=A0ABS8IJ99_9NOSO|nr:hypothetical protein [Nostoc favosum]MCC5603949.1 hypothetical protein [Nostoc favosum CHAB5714]